MGSILDHLAQIVTAHQSLSYYLISLGVIIQGEITLLVAMYLVANHSLNILGVFLFAFLGISTADYFLYFLGRRLRNTKFGWRFYKKIKENKKMQIYNYYVSQNLRKIIIISKFLVGMNILSIFAIGWAKVKFGKFAKSHFESTLVWLFAFSLVSYFLAGGVYLLKAEKIFKQAEVFILGFFVIIIGGELFFKNIVNKFFFNEMKLKKVGEEIEKMGKETKDSFESQTNNKVKSEHLENIFENTNKNKDQDQD
jgi:membrane protein DedA with SNARE-associated domain